MAIAFTFPGQGSQFVGMGQELAQASTSARAIFNEVDEALGENLSRIIWEGPDDELVLTQNAQPALMATSMAVMAVLKDEFDIGIEIASHAAGHSLGEYTALAATGALTLTDAAKLLYQRGAAMQRAVPVGEGGMVALLGASKEQAEALCAAVEAHGSCAIANDNAPGQIVLSGAMAAMQAVVERSRDMGIKKAVLLPVSAPFHSVMMEPAALEMEEAIGQVAIRTPAIPVVTNLTAHKTINPQTIRTQLIDQITGQVRWRESVLYMADQGVDTFIEPGAGRVLSQMLKRTVKGAKGKPLNSMQDIEAFANEIRASAAAAGEE